MNDDFLVALVMGATVVGAIIGTIISIFLI